MAESSINVTEGSGKRLHTYDRTISSVLVQEQAVFPAEYPYATYTIQTSAVSTATLDSHALQIMAGSSLNVRVRSITIEQVTNATSVTLVSYALVRLTTAGTGGTSITPAKHDVADAAAGCTAMSLPSSKGTESTEIRRSSLVMRQAVLATGTQPEENILWVPSMNSKPYIIAAGTSNGLAVKVLNACAGSTIHVTVEVVETAYL